MGGFEWRPVGSRSVMSHDTIFLFLWGAQGGGGLRVGKLINIHSFLHVSSLYISCPIVTITLSRFLLRL